jgi:hypothetical protein
VAESCWSSSGSPPRNSSSDLRLIPASAQHESTSPASLLPRALARTLVLCLVSLRNATALFHPDFRSHSPPCSTALPHTAAAAHSGLQQSCYSSEPAQPHTNPIATKGGFLQVAVSEAPVHSASIAALRSWALQIQP